MQDFKQIKTEELIRELAATFLHLESNGSSLITVTRVTLENRMSKAIILLSVLPDDKEEEALEFVRRKRTEFKAYLETHARISRIPHVDFRIDSGEKNRQRIEDLSSKEKAT